MSESDAPRNVEVPERIAERVEARLPLTEFATVDEYVAFVLEEVLYAVEESTDPASDDGVDEDEVRSRLESLGYLE